MTLSMGFFPSRLIKQCGIKSALVLGLFGLSVGLTWAQTAQSALPPTATSLKMNIEQVKQAMAEEEKLWAEERSRDAEAEVQRQKRFSEFQKEKNALQAQIAGSEQRLQAAVAKLENSKMLKINGEQKFKFLNQKILEHVNNIALKLETSIPYQQDKRLDQAKLLASDIRQDKVSPEESLNRLAALYDKENHLTSDAEFWSGEVTLQNGNRMAVKYLRMGKQVMLYSSPTGSAVGILRKKNNQNWVWVKEDQLDFDTRKAITNAINVAEGKASPGLAEIPFWLQDFPSVAQATQSAQPANGEGAKK